MKEISLDKFEQLDKDSYALIDIRDESARDYGMIPGAIAISFDGDENEAVEKLSAISPDKKLILYCDFGRKTKDLDDHEALQGRDCYSLEGGYTGYICSRISEFDDIEEK